MMLTTEQIKALNTTIDRDAINQLLGYKARILRVIMKKGLITNQDMCNLSYNQILEIKDCGQKTISAMETYLKSKGLAFGMRTENQYSPTPSTEREVWFEDRFLMQHDVDSDPEGMQVECPIMSHRKNEEDSTIHCWSVCAAFRVHDGYAECQMMHGDQIIGRLIEKPKE